MHLTVQDPARCRFRAVHNRVERPPCASDFVGVPSPTTSRGELRPLARQQARRRVPRAGAGASGCPTGWSRTWLRRRALAAARPRASTSRSTLEPSFLARAWAGVLLGGDGARLGYLAAARLHGLTDDGPAIVTVLVARTAGPVSARRGWEFVRSVPASVRARRSARPPRTTRRGHGARPLRRPRGPRTSSAGSPWPWSAAGRRSERLRRALAGRRRHPRRELLEGLLADVAVGRALAARADATCATSSGPTG